MRRVALALPIVAVLLPVVSGGDFNLGRYDLLLLYVCVAIGLNLSLGYAGEFALGQAFAMAAAGYIAGILSAQAGLDFWVTVPAAMVAGVITSLLVHLPGLRLAGWTLAFTGFLAIIVLPDILVMGQRFTGGEDGLLGIRAVGFGGSALDGWVVYEIVLLCTVVVFVAARNLVRSSWGLRLRALRDSPQAAEASGINLAGVKLAAYVMSGVPAGLAGGLLVHVNHFVDPTAFGFNLLVLLLAAVILGGRGTLWGPVVGTAVLQGFSLWVGPFSTYNVLILGAALLLVVIVFPRGLVPAIAALTRRGRGVQRVLEELNERVTTSLTPSTSATARQGLVLEVRDLVKSFGGNRALDGIDVQLRPGTLVGLIGPNGSGKTTFVNVVTGFLRPDSGTIRVNGVDATGLRPSAIARTGVGRTFQVPQLVDELTVRENVELGRCGLQAPGIAGPLLRLPESRRRDQQRRARAVEVCAWLGFAADVIERPAGELPLGLKRVVEIARAVVADPVLICLDEPAAGLNPAEIEWLGVVLAQLRDRGHAILLIEHNVSFVVRTCDDVYLLENGRVSCHGDRIRQGDLPEPLRAYVDLRPRRALVESAVLS